MLKLRKPFVAIGALAAALSLTACSSTAPAEPSSPSSAPSTSAEETVSFSEQDVMFVQQMIPHHEQAVEMADVMLDKDGIDPRVIALAEEIKAAQAPEIATMKEWLAEWNVDESMSGMSHGDDDSADDGAAHGEMTSGGMMSADEMSNLRNTEGVDASRAFLTGMTAHHEGAITMAEIEIAEGTDPGAIALAQSIVDSQQAEIDTMADILASL